MGHSLKSPAAAATRARISLPRPLVDFNTSERELFSITEMMITVAKQELAEADGRKDLKRAEMLKTALGFSAEKLQAVTGGKVTGTDVGGELRQALNVLINTVYL